MRRLSDDEWLSLARARVAAGEEWDAANEPTVPPDAPVLDRKPPAGVEEGRLFACPSCDDHWPLEVYPRYELLSTEPLRYCTRCYGFWAAGDAIIRGVRDPYDDHFAFTAVVAPPRCRFCQGHRFTPEGVCRGCGKPHAPFLCPACAKPMDRVNERGLTLDRCEPCQGTWFDTGEIVRVHQLAPVQGLALSQVDEHAAEQGPSAGMMALDLLLRLFFPWLPF